MPQQQFDFGMIGLGTMGKNLVHNMSEHGFSVAGYDKDAKKVADLNPDVNDKSILGFEKLEEFIGALKSPRVIMLLVPAGPIVDKVVEELKPFLADEDLIMDCGNSHFTDTDRRIQQLEAEGIHFMGVGISGGEEGARRGPSIMPGGTQSVYARVVPMLEAVAAKVNGEPCVARLGPGSAGHYVKMVHNGIEYALMQMIAEAYHILKQRFDFSNDELHEIFSKWNEGKMQSYLMEITADIFMQKDELGEGRLIDNILDASQQNGTGKWTSQSAMDLFVPIPSIDIAVSARDISSLKGERETAHAKLERQPMETAINQNELLRWTEEALFFSMIIAYAQGFALLKQASDKYQYSLNLDEVARIWCGGCIIRSAFLNNIHSAYSAAPQLQNLLLNDDIGLLLENSQDGMRIVLKIAIDLGVPAPVMMASIAYFDSYRCDRLPANLIQAQRDYFGAHTYQRIDREGTFHTHWQTTDSDGNSH
jgi:6-phosphogluconate dehydrogenase